MNHLANETSPYLLQHAHNPVAWYPWGDKALQRAKAEDKPILLSIGYSACHWCHVMERESFEDEHIAEIMNANFINIKVDREERPDIDQIYMEAVQILSGHGGWPLNCFLMPDGRPFYGGTYFPPRPTQGHADWKSVLIAIANAFEQQRPELEKQANNLSYYIFAQQQQQQLDEANHTLLSPDPKNINQLGLLHSEILQEKLDELEQQNKQYFWTNFDLINGGLGNAPKFPNTMALQYMLQYAYYTDHEATSEHAFFSLDAMCQGGIYDHLGGGFARYTVDSAWHIPHFEKMLYDNALLIGLLSDAYKILQYNVQHIGMAGADNELTNFRKKRYAQTIKQSLEWVARDMTSPEGAFYAAIDADTEGEEGKFYIWQKNEIDKLLQDDAPIFNTFFGVTAAGNWEKDKNILYRAYTEAQLADKIGYDDEELNKLLAQCQRKLFLQREKREKPNLDDKIILSWNALMNTAYSKAYSALNQADYKQKAIQNMDFILQNFAHTQNGGLYHNYKNKQAHNYAFLDDYALLIESLLALYQITFDPTYIEHAKYYCNYVIKNFQSNNGGLFYYTHRAQTDLLGRKIEYYDNATPSGNSTMAQNLYLLAKICGNETYQQQAQKMLKSMEKKLLRYTSSFARWASTYLGSLYQSHEIAVVGDAALQTAAQINQLYLPNTILMASKQDNEQYPLLKQRYNETQTLIYTCKGYECHLPSANFEDFTKLLSK